MRPAALLLLACTACGRVSFDARSDGGGDALRIDADPDAPPSVVHCATWAAPVLVPTLSSGNLDFETALSATGTMAFTSARMPGYTGGAIFTALPDGADGWRDVTFHGEINIPQGTVGPAWNGPGTRLYLSRGGSAGVGSAYVSEWNGTTFSDAALIPELPSDIVSIAITPDELEMIWSGEQDISLFYATRSSIAAAWTARGKVPLVIDGSNGWPSITADGLVLYWEHGMTGTAGVYRAARSSRTSAWGTPELVGNLESGGANAGDPEVTPDGTRLFVSRGAGDTDIYMSTCE